MANPLAVSLHASGAETTSGVGAAVDTGAGLVRSAAALRLEVVDSSGTTPTLTVTIETSANGTTGWHSVGQFDLVAGADSAERVFPFCRRYIRANWTIAGTGGPSFTFEIVGTSEVLYATPSDLTNLQLPPAALVNVSLYAQAFALLSVTDEADGYLNGSYTLPLVAWSRDLTSHVAAMGRYAVLSFRGFDPTGKDEAIVKGRDDAIAWLRRIMNGQLEPPGIVDSTPGVFDGGAVVVTQARRGW